MNFINRIKSYLLVVFILGCLILNLAAQEYLGGFQVADKDEGGAIGYYGFKVPNDKDEPWFILRLTDTNTYRVVGNGYTNYNTAWSNRSSITYYPPDEMYKNPYNP